MWIDKIEGTEGLERIFDGEDIENNVNVRKASLENSTLNLFFDLGCWPSKPPEKWVQQQANTVYCQLSLIGFNELVLKDWVPDNVGEFRIKRQDNGGLFVQFVTKSGVYISCICLEAQITKISAYKNA